ncbi:3-hydroxyacyl-ACP dehydratase FabZ family protein [Amycolatopsis sp. CA-230715]|uniref:3-hydroxyacyl-ACP dehydratase FabZ family protein n=1 Tax=Amycolatopsis sp. CA-230715 TaxID=2745196 RepID=UPI001C0151E7|nr:3-hydroxyacyl-ACP dehydratase FabZ family protein [Amycolatopsis sp. CA-230715]QWF85095.1 hypothetical protein HUW46_08549 [Amycolatopsis sp. CA-230715]
MSRVSPVRGAIEVVEPASFSDGAWRSAARFAVGELEPVFAGHYPGFPIFPGVCVVECAHRGVLATKPAEITGLRFMSLGSARFVSAVLPGDVLDIALEWRREDEGVRVAAKVVTGRGKAASARLHYTEEST